MKLSLFFTGTFLVIKRTVTDGRGKQMTSEKVETRRTSICFHFLFSWNVCLDGHYSISLPLMHETSRFDRLYWFSFFLPYVSCRYSPPYTCEVKGRGLKLVRRVSLVLAAGGAPQGPSLAVRGNDAQPRGHYRLDGIDEWGRTKDVVTPTLSTVGSANDGQQATVGAVASSITPRLTTTPPPTAPFYTIFDQIIWTVTSIDLINARSLQSIETSCMIICIDRPPSIVDGDTDRALQMIHGGGSDWNSANRWFDKTVQVMATSTKYSERRKSVQAWLVIEADSLPKCVVYLQPWWWKWSVLRTLTCWGHSARSGDRKSPGSSLFPFPGIGSVRGERRFGYHLPGT